MRHKRPALRRSELRSSAVLKHFPGPVPYRDRGPGRWSFTGAYLGSRGVWGDDDDDESARFPQPDAVAEQLGKDNPVLLAAARGLLPSQEDNPKVTLADAFAEAVQHAEDGGDQRRACNLLDSALFLSKAQAVPGAAALRSLDRYLADARAVGGENGQEGA